MKISNVQYVRDLLLTCPFIEVGKQDMHIDFIGLESVQFSIDSEPTDPLIKTYLGGGQQCRYSFVLRAKFDTLSEEDYESNIQLFEKLRRWLNQINAQRDFPPMNDQKTPRSIQAKGNAYLYESEQDGNSAQYIMQIELQYYQGGF